MEETRKDALTDRRGIILIPYAEKKNSQSGENIKADANTRADLYFKNCCVAAISARKHNDDHTDVALVTDIQVPPKYEKLLQSNGVLVIQQDFDTFCFADNYTWSLAFYKLCAVYKVVQQFPYDYYAYLDSDVYVQSDFSPIWKECDDHILLYDINHGLQVEHYRSFLSEVEQFTKEKVQITQFGGEFFAANRASAAAFLETCMGVYLQMKETGFVTVHGDEFIISLAAAKHENVKNAGAYVYRFWTGTFRLVSTSYHFNPVVVLHVPAEKEAGMLVLYRKYISKGKCPKNQKVYRILHLKHRSVKTVIKDIYKKIRK